MHDTQCGQTEGGIRLPAGMCSFLDTLSDPSLCPAPDNLYAGVSCSKQYLDQSLTGLVTICRCLGSTSSDQSVRLFAETTEGDRVRGVVEIMFNGRWGLLCRPPIENQVAGSVCEGLGYSREDSQLMGTPEARSA